MNTLEHMRKLVEDLSRMKEGSLFEVIDTMREGADALADALGLLRDARENGLIYWEPNTTRGAIQRMEMFGRIDALLAKHGKTEEAKT